MDHGSFELHRAYKMERKKQKKQRKSQRPIPPPEYSIVDGVRYVKPYVHEFVTNAKGRWLQRELLEVLTTEFGGHSPSYWEDAIASRRIYVNGKPAAKDYVFCDNGFFFVVCLISYLPCYVNCCAFMSFVYI